MSWPKSDYTYSTRCYNKGTVELAHAMAEVGRKHRSSRCVLSEVAVEKLVPGKVLRPRASGKGEQKPFFVVSA